MLFEALLNELSLKFQAQRVCNLTVKFFISFDIFINFGQIFVVFKSGFSILRKNALILHNSR